MRILMLAQSYPPTTGGEQHHVRNLSIELVTRGHDVTVATLGERICQHLSTTKVYVSIAFTARCNMYLHCLPTKNFGIYHHFLIHRYYAHSVALSSMNVQRLCMPTTGWYIHSHHSKLGARLSLFLPSTIAASFVRRSGSCTRGCYVMALAG